jgi:CubicO group peptidase (beta-lactamase class C family)
MSYAFEYPYKVAPGTVPAYHTSDTYLLFKAMQSYLGSDLFNHIKTEVYAPLNIAPDVLDTLRTWENGGWSNGEPLGGYGMWWTHDAMAKISRFLNQDAGKINNAQVLNVNQLNAAMQRDAADRGMDLSVFEDSDAMWYNNGTWAFKYAAGDTYTNGQVYSCDWYLPFMVGYGGIIVLLGPNHVNYWYFSDAGLVHWGDAVTEMNKIAPFCN